ncbi:phage head closure protein [Paraburkholderia sp. MM5477-R1]|uniref:phage head closure protein n=1 Tax=Paraburkholderia sp. MM5477-R1 TaxID=2991062 RepID=UPI003D199051
MTRRTTGADAARLEQRVNIERPVVTQEPTGEAVADQWEPFATVWAEIVPLKGREWLMSAEYRPNVISKIRIRWLEGVDASMRVVFGTKVYGIDVVLPTVLGKPEMWLMCTDGSVTEGGQP